MNHFRKNPQNRQRAACNIQKPKKSGSVSDDELLICSLSRKKIFAKSCEDFGRLNNGNLAHRL
jgi:hypothetical protein